MSTMLNHPFYPPNLNPTGYAANTMSISAILGAFAIAVVSIIGFTSIVLKIRPSISRGDKILVGWFVFKGYFVFNHQTMPRRLDLLGQMWKEYAKADSRYMTMEPFVLCMESITAFAWGPLCYFIAWMIVADSPHRHPTQMIVSMGQLYGDVLYYATSIAEEKYHGVSYSRPETFYYWGYFIFLNSFWILIPAFCMYQSYSAMVGVFRQSTVRSAKKNLKFWGSFTHQMEK
ncbi:unnamed protein product [Penicillium glandicola]